MFLVSQKSTGHIRCWLARLELMMRAVTGWIAAIPKGFDAQGVILVMSRQQHSRFLKILLGLLRRIYILSRHFCVFKYLLSWLRLRLLARTSQRCVFRKNRSLASLTSCQRHDAYSGRPHHAVGLSEFGRTGRCTTRVRINTAVPVYGTGRSPRYAQGRSELDSRGKLGTRRWLRLTYSGANGAKHSRQTRQCVKGGMQACHFKRVFRVGFISFHRHPTQFTSDAPIHSVPCFPSSGFVPPLPGTLLRSCLCSHLVSLRLVGNVILYL